MISRRHVIAGLAGTAIAPFAAKLPAAEPFKPRLVFFICGSSNVSHLFEVYRSTPQGAWQRCELDENQKEIWVESDVVISAV